MVYFVESSREASESVRQNLRSLEIGTGIRVMQLDVLTALHRLEAESVAGDFTVRPVEAANAERTGPSVASGLGTAHDQSRLTKERSHDINHDTRAGRDEPGTSI